MAKSKPNSFKWLERRAAKKKAKAAEPVLRARKPLLIVDIDGTIADSTQRYTEAGIEPNRTSSPKEHDEWLGRVQSTETLAKDTVVPMMQFLVTRLNSTMDIAYLTARSDDHLKVTLEWLAKKGFPNADIIMRDSRDKRPTREYKHSAILDVTSRYKATKVITLDDDHSGEMAAVYKLLGILHLKPTFCAYDPQAFTVLPAYATAMQDLPARTQPLPETLQQADMLADFKKETA